MCLGNISKDSTVGYVYDSSVGYNTINGSDAINICKYLLKET